MNRKKPLIPVNVQKNLLEVNVKFIEKKFSVKHLSRVADILNTTILSQTDEPHPRRIVFDLSRLEWVGHEELVFLSGFFHHLFLNEYNFYIKLKNKRPPNKRKALLLLQLWDNWEIYSFVPLNSQGFRKFDQYFDIDDRYISFLKKKILKHKKKKDYLYEKRIYGFTNITPFFPFEILPRVDEKLLTQELEKVHLLDEQTELLLSKHHSEKPFLNKSLSLIISKELFENSIEHAFLKQGAPTECYFGISLKNKISDDENDLKSINWINKSNFADESIEETINFFFRNGEYLNRSFLQYTFLDFGQGISKTLKDNYLESGKNSNHTIAFNQQHQFQNEDTKILEYAFNYSSSRHPIDEKILNRENIPRGLFDLLSIVRRYRGLIIARSNYGKVLFDFSGGESVIDSIRYFDSGEKTFFPGTIITLFIPESLNDISLKSIKPETFINNSDSWQQTHYLSIQKVRKDAEDILVSIPNQGEYKEKIYNIVFSQISDFLDRRQTENSIIYFDFSDSRLDFRIFRKILLFLASDYRINTNTNAIVLNPPDIEIVKQIQYEILILEDIKKLTFHPLPCIFTKSNFELSEVVWLGLKDKSDEVVLNKLFLYETHSFRKDDFENPDNILGNLFSFDPLGNLISDLREYGHTSIEIFTIRNTLSAENTYYLCAGNYYQSQFISFLETLQDDEYCDFIATLLVKQLSKEEIFKKINIILSITLSSQLLAKSVLKKIKERHPERYRKIDFVRLSNYNSFESEEYFKNISSKDNVLLICDVISTGYLVHKLKLILEKENAHLLGLSAIVDTRIKNDENTQVKCYFEEIEDLTINTLYDLPIKKLKRGQIEDFNECEIIRINPITNSVNSLSKKKSYTHKIIYSDPANVFELYPELIKYLKIGCFHYNNVFHSYYFDTHKLLRSDLGEKLLMDLIEQLSSDKSVAIDQMDYLFYPIYSGVEVIEHDVYKKSIFKKHTLKVFPLARFITPYGWRFSFPPKFLNKKTSKKHIFIIDDGSVSGATITQMIDELCFLDIKSITFLSIFGRLEDYQREFFSRIEMASSKNPSHPIPVKIFFGITWNIPVYTLGVKNPFYKEKEDLKKLTASTIIPPFIKPIIEKRLIELEFHHPSRISEKYFNKDLSYLPKIKGKMDSIPLKEIYIVRDAIGKIAGYRFYSEYFIFFDNFINFYNKKEFSEKRYKRIELLLSVLIHEPHLSEKLREILPDVFEKLVEFINLIVIKKKIKVSDLIYEWPNQSIMRLFFILNQFNLSTVIKSKLKDVFKFCETDITKKSYGVLFYYLIKEIPTSTQESDILEYAGDIEVSIQLLINEPGDISKDTLLLIKQFSSYLRSNPYIHKQIDESASLKALESFFLNEQNIVNHNDCLNSQFGRLKAAVDNCEQCLYSNSDMSDEIVKIKKEWDDIIIKIEVFLKYMAGLEPFSQMFFKGKIFNISHKNEFSIHSIRNEMNKILFSKRDSWNHDTIKSVSHYIDYLIRYLVEDSSDFVSLFTAYKTKIVDLWFDMKNDFSISNKELDFIDNTAISISDAIVELPYVLLKNEIFGKIFTNFRHASKEKPIRFGWSRTENKITLIIINTINKEQNSENGKPDMKSIKGYFNFSYHSEHKDDDFIQTLHFGSIS